MAEYIEREAVYALSKKICDAIRNREYHPATFGHLILDWIDDLPAADVAPVRHGRWIAVDFHSVKCALCGFTVDIMKVDAHVLNHMNYCPNCGARMDGGKKAVTA